eukprot:snap_masked-scaffold884_size84903-processed-gene-0.7 protein:Tk09304 transcript:snap_masked-scaffold884_size84903-processed-gene-0.7-mRNA-1 annotation:"AGAP012241-PA"
MPASAQTGSDPIRGGEYNRDCFFFEWIECNGEWYSSLGRHQKAYYIMFQSYTNTSNPDPMPSPLESILSIFIMSLGSFGSVWEGLGSTNHSFLGKIVFK